MENSTTVVGLDVAKEIIAAAVLPPHASRPTDVRKVVNRTIEIERFIRSVQHHGPLTFVYEAGFCGYELQRFISALGHRCVIIAPSLIPKRPGDRVKTDRRDAEKLARLYRAGELTEVRIPTRAEEAVRDLIRTREDCLEDRLRAYHRLTKFLLRQGRNFEGKSGGILHRKWLREQRFDLSPHQRTYEVYVQTLDECEQRRKYLTEQIEELAGQEPYQTPVRYLRCLRGVEVLTAMTLFSEAQDFRRFKTAREFMGFTGMVPSEFTSSFTPRRGRITKTGNAHIRRVLVESALNYRGKSLLSRALNQRRQGCPPEIIAIAKKAETRLNRKLWRMLSAGKNKGKTTVAVARELSGFVWAIGQHFPVQASA